MTTADAFGRAADVLQLMGGGRLDVSGSPEKQISFREFTEAIEKDVPVGPGNISEWIFATVGTLMPTTHVDLPTLKSNFQKQMVSSARVLRGVSNVDEMKTAISDLSSELRMQGLSTPEFTNSLLLPVDARDLRVLQVCIRCFAIHKKSPVEFIENAWKRNQQAVLALVKIEKMFLHDICTQSVITEAEHRVDRPFLLELGRAVSYMPRPSKRRVIQALLYVLFALGTEIPTHANLQAWFDPDGTIFSGVYAFDKFVCRCRKEFDTF